MFSSIHYIKHYIFKLVSSFKLNTIFFFEGFFDIFAWENPKNIRVYIPEGTQYSQIIKKCFSDWEEITQHNISFNYTNDKKIADIEVCFKSLPNKSLHWGVTQKVKGYCDAVTKMLITVFLRDCHSGRILSKEELRAICLHEIGHAIGLWRHSFNKNSIMYSKLIDGIKQEILKEDVERLKKIYKFY